MKIPSYSYTPDYFSIEDILTTEEPVSCKIEVLLPSLGYIDSSSDEEDLKPGTKLELPLWLAQKLHASQRPIVNIDIPKVYKEAFREMLEADATAIMLSKWNLHYYELGMKLARISSQEGDRILESLYLAFKSRFRLVMDWAENPITDLLVIDQFPRLEKYLFFTGKKTKVQLSQWMNKGSGEIEAADVVTRMKKRKRTDYESD